MLWNDALESLRADDVLHPSLTLQWSRPNINNNLNTWLRGVGSKVDRSMGAWRVLSMHAIIGVNV